MLVIVLVFTAFGIPYAKNNFVGTVVTVEGYLNDFSGWLMNFYNTIHNLIDEWLPKIAETLEPLKGVIEQLSGIVNDIYVSIKPNIENALGWWHDTFEGLSRHLAFFREYGFYVINGDWWNKYNFFGKVETSSAIYNDGVYDWDKFNVLYDAYITGVYTDEFAYVQYSYEEFQKKTFNLATKNYPDQYDLFVISRESIPNIYKKSLEDVYKCLVAHDMPVVVLKVPKFSNLLNYFEPKVYLDLFTVKDFSLDYMTGHNFSITASPYLFFDDIKYEPLLVNFVSDSSVPDNRIIVNNPINSYFKSHNVIGSSVDNLAVMAGSFDCSFLFKVGNVNKRISGRDFYEMVLEEYGLDDSGMATGDIAYPSVYAYFISSDILEFDYKGIFDDWIY